MVRRTGGVEEGRGHLEDDLLLRDTADDDTHFVEQKAQAFGCVRPTLGVLARCDPRVWAQLGG